MKGKIVSEGEIFEAGYCDKPLYDGRNLDTLFRYIRENPHRLAMRKQFPEFFRTIRNLRIGEHEYEAYGNLFLFRNPDKEPVKISRKFSPEEIQEKKTNWRMNASKGTILVSPFISRAEKEVRSETENDGGRFILIIHENMGSRFKPAGHDYSLCCQGRLLIISLGLPIGTALT